MILNEHEDCGCEADEVYAHEDCGCEAEEGCESAEGAQTLMRMDA